MTGIEQTRALPGIAKTATGAAECETRICLAKDEEDVLAKTKITTMDLLVDGLFRFAAASAP